MATVTSPLGSEQFHLVSEQLTAIQHIERLRGGSQSQLLRASDGNYYVTKFLGNPQHDRILANEFFVSRLGRRLSLPVPDVAPIEVPDWLIQQSPDLHLEFADKRKPLTSGVHLASRLAGNPGTDQMFDYVSEDLALKTRNRSDFPRCVVLDKWVSNTDGRQAVFVRHPSEDDYLATFIDHGFAFNGGEWTFSDGELQGVYCRNYVYCEVTSWESFEPALTFAEQMDAQEIWECAAPIPSEWCFPDPHALPKLVDELDRRRSRIRDLITRFRNSNRDPFPKWIGN